MGSEHAGPRGRGDPVRAFGKREGLAEGEFGLRQVTGRVPGAPADGEASGTHHPVFGTGRAIRGVAQGAGDATALELLSDLAVSGNMAAGTASWP